MATTTNCLLSSAAVSASYNMILQLGFRLLTFVVNACILRYISSELLGVVNVRLTLLYSTTLFLSREAFRRACLSNIKDKDWRQVINLVWCVVPCAVLWAGLLSAIWIHLLQQPDPSRIPYYSVSVVLYALSTIIEITCEPLWLVGQSFLFIRLKVVIEGAMVMSRCLLSIALVVYFPSLGILGFSFAQVVGTCVFPISYYFYFLYYTRYSPAPDRPEGFPLRNFRDFFPRAEAGKPFMGTGILLLTMSFFKQSLLKQLLTEGEKYAMTIFDILSFADQGTFDVISNLGSLVARFVFLPIEDSAYLFFSQSLTRGEPVEKQKKEFLKLSCEVLEALISIVTLIGLTILTFGFAYSHLFLDLYGGGLLSSGTGPTLLRCYCMYVYFLAVNGVSECFVFATMSQKEVDSYNKKMLFFSFAFLATSYFLAKKLGAVGFILANCLNMMLRISHSNYFIHRYTKPLAYRPLRGLVPTLPVLMAFAISLAVTTLSEAYFCCDHGNGYRLLHVVCGAVCLLILTTTIYLRERKLVSFVLEQYRHRKTSSKID